MYCVVDRSGRLQEEYGGIASSIGPGSGGATESSSNAGTDFVLAITRCVWWLTVSIAMSGLYYPGSCSLRARSGPPTSRMKAGSPHTTS